MNLKIALFLGIVPVSLHSMQSAIIKGYKSPYFEMRLDKENNQKRALAFSIPAGWANLTDKSRVSFSWVEYEVFDHKNDDLIEALFPEFPQKWEGHRNSFKRKLSETVGKHSQELYLEEECILWSPLVVKPEGWVTGWYLVGQVLSPNRKYAKRSETDCIIVEAIVGRVGAQLEVIPIKFLSKNLKQKRHEEIFHSLDEVLVRYQKEER